MKLPLFKPAFQIVTPYVGGCPGCADELFSAIVNESMASVHREGRGVTYVEGESRRERFEAQAAATSRKVAAPLGHRCVDCALDGGIGFMLS